MDITNPISDEFFRFVLTYLVLELCKPKLWYQMKRPELPRSPKRWERTNYCEDKTKQNADGRTFHCYYNNSIRIQEYTEYKWIKYIRWISEITINYIAAEKYTKYNWKWYADTELSEYHSSCKSGPCEYKSAKPKLLAARAENRGTQSLG